MVDLCKRKPLGFLVVFCFCFFLSFKSAFSFFLFISGILQAQSGDECVLSECHTGNTLVMSVSVILITSDCHIGNEYFDVRTLYR